MNPTRDLIYSKLNENITLFHHLDQEFNRKRGRREHRNRNSPNQIGNPSRRGDISVIHGDCDGEIFGSVFYAFLTTFCLFFHRKPDDENERSYRTCQEIGKGHL